ncbi:MAG TPA: 4'-phosphopantetheinyl transferase superfamily protein [Rhodobacteraceae bacterium]|nr:4'-phosphopantetheinyl transferase superfamily protein [Paracoccaceae bacterium]
MLKSDQTIAANTELVKGVSIYLCDLDTDSDIPLSFAQSLLSPSEHARAKRFHFERDQKRFIRGRGFLRYHLSKRTGIPAGQIHLEEGERGKPFCPERQIHFNLSHSRNIAVLALSPSAPIGIDIEFIDRKVDVHGLSRTCFNASECAVLSSLTGDDLHRRFFAFWTAKEARMKLTGEGMSLAPKSISLALENGRPVGYLLPEHPTATLNFVELPIPGMVCCTATLSQQ